jgi:hypothetical protein
VAAKGDVVRPRIVAWSIAVLGITLNVLAHVLDLFNGHRFPPPITGTIVAVAFLIVGALIASRHPRNPIGWIYIGAITLISFGGSGNVASQYAYYALVTRPGALPASDWVLWAGQTILSAAFGTLAFFALLLFPDGRLPSERWRALGVAAVAGIAVETVVAAIAPDALVVPGAEVLRNPASVAAAGPLIDLIAAPFAALGGATLLGCLASVVARFRKATGVERQQLKWFAYGAAWIPAFALLAGLQSVVAPATVSSALVVWPLYLAGIPVMTAIAMLRYRLYDIDLLINRTLVYVATTAIIAAAFFGGIVVLQTILRPLTSGSELAVAVSTLISFAVFQPIRARVQSTVDGRFYRSRYDAARTLDAFSVRLRDQVALDAVSNELLDAVGRTVQPATASLWLRHQPR